MTVMNRISSATLAATAMAMLAGGLVTLTTSVAVADAVHCAGINSCKGQSACKTASNACKGQNSCKGQGWIEQPSAEACAAAGGKVID